MSKRTKRTIEEIDQFEANQSEESQPQIEVLVTNTIIVKKNYNYYLELTNWKLNDKIDKAVLKKAFPNFND
ncbi:5069_t:CDS:1, partial [Dentiscutata heterogama]